LARRRSVRAYVGRHTRDIARLHELCPRSHGSRRGSYPAVHVWVKPTDQLACHGPISVGAKLLLHNVYLCGDVNASFYFTSSN